MSSHPPPFPAIVRNKMHSDLPVFADAICRQGLQITREKDPAKLLASLDDMLHLTKVTYNTNLYIMTYIRFYAARWIDAWNASCTPEALRALLACMVIWKKEGLLEIMPHEIYAPLSRNIEALYDLAKKPFFQPFKAIPAVATALPPRSMVF